MPSINEKVHHMNQLFKIYYIAKAHLAGPTFIVFVVNFMQKNII